MIDEAHKFLQEQINHLAETKVGTKVFYWVVGIITGILLALGQEVFTMSSTLAAKADRVDYTHIMSAIKDIPKKVKESK